MGSAARHVYPLDVYPFDSGVTFSRRILFARHGETAWNVEGRLQGQHDIPLNPRGRAQASALGQTLRSAHGAELDRLDRAGAFVASPLSRARETMELMREGMGLAPETYRRDPALMELSFGRWEGITWAEAAERDPKAVRARFGDKWNAVPPGGESYAMLAERVSAWLRTLGGEVFVVAHGGVARALMKIAGEPAEAAVEAPIQQGRAMVFDSAGWRYFA